MTTSLFEPAARLTDDLTGIPPTWRANWAPDHDTPIYRDVLALLGIPGLTPASECADYYRDTRQFRPRRPPVL